MARPWTGTRHVRRPPIRGKEREQKKIMSLRNGSFLGEMLGIITEGADLLDAFFKALPRDVRDGYRWKGGTAFTRLQYVVENLEHISIPKLVQNIIQDALEDAAFGKIGKQQAKAHQLMHKHFGIDLSGRLPKPYNIPVPM